MRILHVISGDLWAGAESMAFHLISGLSEQRQVEISAILFNDGKLAGEIRKLGVPVTIADETGSGPAGIIKRIGKELEAFHPDIIHSHGLKENLLAYAAATMSGDDFALINTQHGMPEPVHRKLKSIKRYLLSRCNMHLLKNKFKYIIAVSEEMRKELIGTEKVPPEKIRVIHNGTKTDCPVPLRRRPGNPFVIGSAGRFFPVKDYGLMVEIAMEIDKQAGTARFELAGDGPERGLLMRLIRGYRLEEKFILRGHMEDMTEFYGGIDLYLNTSLHEGLPMSVLEAMAHGIPIVVPDVGGMGEIITDGVEGCIIGGRDPKSFAEKCIELMNNRPEYLRMAAASRGRVVQEFSYAGMADRYFHIYRESAFGNN